ncbi:MAG: Dyp-type peroxidase [Pontibacterium sp.]
MSAYPQPGITAEANSSAVFLTFNQRYGQDAEARILGVLRKIPELEAEYQQAYPEAQLTIVAAIGSGYWHRISPHAKPAELAPFPALENGDNVAPFTPVDLFFHIRSERKDLNFKLATELTGRLAESVTLVEQVNGFRYLDSRDLTGFVDGTENPEGEQRLQVAVVGDEDPDFKGGSYIHIQRYVHNMTDWNSQSLKTQEEVFGRSKVANIEYPDEEKALTAHTKRTSLKDEQGQSVEILRHSLPYGDMEHCGLLFASYCRTPGHFTLMLESMINGDAEGHTDHLLKYTRAVTGAAFFAPSVDWLESLGS